jgi:hypothetical protein
MGLEVEYQDLWRIPSSGEQPLKVFNLRFNTLEGEILKPCFEISLVNEMPWKFKIPLLSTFQITSTIRCEWTERHKIKDGSQSKYLGI